MLLFITLIKLILKQITFDELCNFNLPFNFISQFSLRLLFFLPYGHDEIMTRKQKNSWWNNFQPALFYLCVCDFCLRRVSCCGLFVNEQRLRQIKDERLRS